MPNVHSVLKLAETTQHPCRRLEGSKKGRKCDITSMFIPHYFCRLCKIYL